MMPKRMAFVSGESSAYTPPAQPDGSPAISPASVEDAAACLRNSRREVLACVIYLSIPRSIVVTIT